MNTNPHHIIPTTVRETIVSALDEMTRDAQSSEVDAAELLGMNEDEMVEAFGSDVSDALCALSFQIETEDVQTCCVTFDCPGWILTLGTVAVYDARKRSGCEWVATWDVTEDGMDAGTWAD